MTDDKPIGGWQYIDTLVEYDGVAKAELAALRATLEEYEKANRGLADINGALTIRNLELKKAIAQTIETYNGSNEQLHRELEEAKDALRDLVKVQGDTDSKSYLDSWKAAMMKAKAALAEGE